MAARWAIDEALREFKPDEVCSGECPLGGIDIWAKEGALAEGIRFIPFPPKENNWENGFKPRNLQIAASDHVLCIVVKELPWTYQGRRFESCYHCARHGNPNPPHIKSGGCWTAWQCKSRSWVII